MDSFQTRNDQVVPLARERKPITEAAYNSSLQTHGGSGESRFTGSSGTRAGDHQTKQVETCFKTNKTGWFLM